MVISINQCDMVLKGRYWNHDDNHPDSQLISFLEEKVVSVRSRIVESTGITTSPIYY